ncbi:MAG TPA: hypothetical protein VJ302_04505, partial [Blastocatellia bacterium]|nr:hypothetical protein [Blastocatellia bacterium]
TTVPLWIFLIIISSLSSFLVIGGAAINPSFLNHTQLSIFQDTLSLSSTVPARSPAAHADNYNEFYELINKSCLRQGLIALLGVD